MEIAERNHFREITEEVLKKGSNLRFTALGMSMHPFIRNGEILIVEPITAKNLEIGNIVFFKTDLGSLIAHRMLGREDSGNILTKGDFGHMRDSPVEPRNILGRVIAVEKRSGRQVNLDRGYNQLINQLLARTSILNFSLYRWYKKIQNLAFWPARPILRGLQGLKTYRLFIRKHLGPVQYRLADRKDFIDLVANFGYRDPKLDAEFKRTADRHSNDKCDAFHLVAEIKTKLAGTIAAERIKANGTLPGTWKISRQIVRNRYRGTGVGEELIKQTLAKIAASGGKHVKLAVDQNHAPALSLYRKLGFIEANHTDGKKIMVLDI